MCGKKFGMSHTNANDANTENGTSPVADPKPSDPPRSPGRKKTLLRRVLIIGAVIVALALIVGAIVMFVAKSFTEQEKEVRSDWSVETGDLIHSENDLGVRLYDAGIDSQLRVVRILPSDSGDAGFTYYDTGVQDRISQTITELQTCGIPWTADNPLAIINPYGTGSNGLYLYFETDSPTSVTYTIRVDGASDFTATVNDISVSDEVDSTEQGLSNVHSFQMIGLVPGATNRVTMTIVNAQGKTTQNVTFTLDMPETHSGYPAKLESTDGESTQELSSGLYALVRTNGYLGYGFFFDNEGTMRYEMVTEGFGLDRMLTYENDLVVCTSTQAISRIDGLGRVVCVYDLGNYHLHHDINYGPNNTVIALVENAGQETVEDVVVEIDLETQQVTELIDFSEFMADYKNAYTHTITPTSTFFWQAGEWDWIHLNSVEYLAEDDAIIVSSRETSTIMKIDDIHSTPAISYFLGDETVWDNTPYESYSLSQEGEFTPQYGQHAVEYDGEGPTEDSYYLLVYNNNYWANSTRDDYSPDLDGTDVGTDLYSGTASYVYRYLVDEEERTYELVSSFAVPYSSIVSNASHIPQSENYVVNSGVANSFGEYDEQGVLIREFSYTCQLQGYRVFKGTFEGFWFAAAE